MSSDVDSLPIVIALFWILQLEIAPPVLTGDTAVSRPRAVYDTTTVRAIGLLSRKTKCFLA